jgi:hypothetical protein
MKVIFTIELTGNILTFTSENDAKEKNIHKFKNADLAKMLEVIKAHNTAMTSELSFQDLIYCTKD